MYEVLTQDLNLKNNKVTAIYNKHFDYLDFFVKNSGDVDHLQISDHVYLLIDEQSNQLVGGKIMSLKRFFELQEVENLEYKNMQYLIKVLYDKYN